MTCAKRLLRAPVMRRLASLALLASLITPAILAAIPFLQSPGTTCSMACCKRSGVCCCRKSQTHERGGAQWKADAKCRGGCTGAPAVSPVVLQAVVQERESAEPALSSVSFHSFTRRASRSAGAAFALFGRPPPLA